MVNSNIILLLQIINSKADIGPMLKKGLRYSQISRLTQSAKDQGFIVESDEGLSITAKGLSIMRYDIKRGKIRKDGGWISPEEESRIKSIGIDEVYLPTESKSHFEK
jgi:hypothetical protein